MQITKLTSKNRRKQRDFIKIEWIIRNENIEFSASCAKIIMQIIIFSVKNGLNVAILSVADRLEQFYREKC